MFDRFISCLATALLIFFLVVSFDCLPDASGESGGIPDHRISAFNVTGSVMPTNATVRIKGGNIVHDNTTGNFTIAGLANGSHVVLLYVNDAGPYMKIVKVNGSDTDAGGIDLTGPLPNGTVVGPILYTSKEPVEEGNVTFALDGALFNATTNTTGYATFRMLDHDSIPNGTIIYASKGTESIEWTHPDQPPWMTKPALEKAPFALLVTSIILLIIVLIGLVVLFIRRSV